MATRVRKDVTKLSQAEEDLLIKAWIGIQALPPDDENSFFKIAGYHGMPFRGAGWGNSQWWGGYCHHGNVSTSVQILAGTSSHYATDSVPNMAQSIC